MSISVMIVDDEHLERVLIAKTYNWQEEGFEIVAEAENGKQALELYRQLEPQLVVTDINMPFMDGLELSEKIKGINDSTEITIISGFDEFRYAQKAITIGVNSFILKPINPKELAESARKSKKTIEAREELVRQSSLMKCSESPTMQTPSQILNKILTYIDSNFCDYTLSLRTIAAEFYMNYSYLSRLFKQHTGKNITEYILLKRMEKAEKLLIQTNLKNYEIAEKIGINDPHYFAQCFKKQYQQSPTKFRRNKHKK